MASGNRAVVLLRLPPPLKVIAECYQKDRNLPSLNAALIELLETHPQLVSLVEVLYAGLNTAPPTGEGC
jgi:hypothetical protein